MGTRTAQWLNAELSRPDAIPARQWLVPVPSWAGCQLERLVGLLLSLTIADPGAAGDDRL